MLVGTEEEHTEVVAAFEKLLAAGRALVTTNYVVLETAALLQHRFGLEPVRDLDERIVPLVTIRWVSEALHLRAMKRLLREDRRDLSLVDCVSFEIMEAEGIRDALALDEDFEREGFRLIPGKK